MSEAMSESLRPIEALALDGVVPGEIVGKTPFVRMLAPTALFVDPAYQRDLTPKSLALIGKLVAGWRWSRFKPPIVVEDAGRWHVIDGQHTAIAAASHPAISEIPVFVVEAASLQARAGDFLGHNRDRLAMTGVALHRAAVAALHRAAVAAGEARALTLQRVIDAAGLALTDQIKSAYGAGETRAVARLYALLDERGDAEFAAVCDCLADLGLAPVKQWHISTVRQLLFERSYGLAAAEVVRVFLRLGEADVERQATVLALSHRLSRGSAAAVVIFRASARQAA